MCLALLNDFHWQFPTPVCTTPHTAANGRLPFLDKHAGDRAEVGGAEGPALEAADEAPARELGAVGADPGSDLGRGPAEKRDGGEGRAAGGPGRDGAGGVPQTGQTWCSCGFVCLFV